MVHLMSTFHEHDSLDIIVVIVLMHAGKNNNNKRLETRKIVTNPYEWNDINIYVLI